MPGAEDDGVVFSSVRVALREAAAAAAGAKNASVWLTGTTGREESTFNPAARGGQVEIKR